jgi:demethylmenaquinone methyltransferase/2-methoxy-6-polyprenyl-1,4-benzoquinol methylase
MRPDSQGLRRLYAGVAGTYERVNHALTLGLDRRWRVAATRWAAPLAPCRCLDLCSGTGEMAEGLRRVLGRDLPVVCADLSRDMLEHARAKALLAGAGLTIAEARALPFRDASFDLVTMGFAARNVHTDRAAFLDAARELRRVLTPGGAYLNLETSQPASPLLRRLFHLYVAATVRPLGRLLSHSPAGYRYLAYTIPRFCDGDAFAALLLEAGFSPVAVHPLLGGVAAIHFARNPGGGTPAPAVANPAPMERNPHGSS